MEDKLLNKMFTEHWRWEQAIDVGVGKNISKAELIKLISPETRAKLYIAIKNGTYKIAPPHVAQIPKKDSNELRTVYICENLDRIFFSIYNNLIFDTCKDMIHPQCKSYQIGIGTGKVVNEVVKNIKQSKSKEIGSKLDLSKYFDSVPIKYIDELFDKIDERCGKSAVTEIVRTFYHQNLCFDIDGNLIEHFFSLGQGVAFASFLADAMLYDMDKYICENYDVYYVRYSDDILCIGKDWQKALEKIREMLAKKELTLNPKKVETLTKDKYFKFLGYSIRGTDISLSKTRIKDFQKEIEKRTLKSKKKNVVADVCNYLYRGNGKYSWATSVLSVVNIKEDIETLNEFVMDCIRAVSTGKKKVGGLGYETSKKLGVITRGIGKNVTANRLKTDKDIAGYKSLMCMRNALLTDKDLYNTFVRSM